LTLAAHRVAEARRIVDQQNDLIGALKASGNPTLEAEAALRTFLSSLAHLEGHERAIRKEEEAKKRESRNRR